MRVGRFSKCVRLSRSPQTSGDSDGYFEDLSPPDWWCAMQAQGPTGEGRGMEFLITGRWHPQITMDTRIVYSDPVLKRDRQFFVRSYQNVDERNKELQLICEEVTP